ncbi:MAG: formylglycine-generating enzyme family protein [Treponema sp.]|nr:formylglycine-generating enzyme family protein [Treponema sp.]
MKKIKMALLAIATLTLLATIAGCSSTKVASTKTSDTSSSGVFVPGATIKGAIEGSEVFIEGRTVNIPSLWICDHEVTQEEYQAVMGSNPSYFSSSPARGEVQAKRPVECVSWYDALVYCNKRSIREGRTPCYKISGKSNPSEWGAVPTSSNSTWDAATCDFTADGYRLPTEAEWEYFARGGNTRQTTYSGSKTVGKVAWYYDNSGRKTHEVKKKAANALGLYDMCGNVDEWCWDCYGSISPSTPSSGVSSGSVRVLRGGGWNYYGNYCTVSYRDCFYPHACYFYAFGFRVVSSKAE